MTARFASKVTAAKAREGYGGIDTLTAQAAATLAFAGIKSPARLTLVRCPAPTPPVMDGLPAPLPEDVVDVAFDAQALAVSRTLPVEVPGRPGPTDAKAVLDALAVKVDAALRPRVKVALADQATAPWGWLVLLIGEAPAKVEPPEPPKE